MLYKKDRQENNNWLKVIQTFKIEPILFLAHNYLTGSHMGQTVMFKKTRRYYFWLQMFKVLERLEEIDQAAALKVDEIFQVLDHESMSGNDNKSGDTAKLKVNDISRQPYGGLFLVLTHEKNNQRDALKCNKYEKSAVRKLPIPPDNPNNQFKPVYDILKMISLCSLNADDALFLETNSSNSPFTPPPTRYNNDKKSTFRFRISRLSSQQSPLKSISNQVTPYFISTFHDIK
ncbi:4712_t:CDS:2 [Cetraspora pellucida]|uniref:4712_t:CDS:1 n=1 Tax=Cetraspora pellucida TaxID=1433469 RepID=A0ACA9KUZ7_9GLOM|nr:4712_t:CDS:2 [Cetraspora pellucida]